jgi:hypothetical protein
MRGYHKMPDGTMMKNSKTAHKKAPKYLHTKGVPKTFHHVLDEIGKTMRERGEEKPEPRKGTGKFMHLKKGTAATKAFMADLRSMRRK